MYHRFDENKFPSTSISKALFEKHIKHLIDGNIKILPLTELSKYFKEKKRLPERSVFITIDDAFKSFYFNGFPILKKYELPFSVFVSADFVSNEPNSDFMSWSMLKEISKNNGLVLNHSKSHRSFLEINETEIVREVKENQKKLEDHLGVQLKIFSYPFGESNQNIEDLIKLLNYEFAFSQHSAPIQKNENKFRLPRFSLNDEFGNLKRFKTIIKSKPLNAFDISFNDTILKSSRLELSFKSNFPSEMINCFINNSAELEKKNIFNEVRLYINKLKVGVRYRINCTLVDQKR
jgi:Predicted xylanase/chitin deacetylase